MALDDFTPDDGPQERTGGKYFKPADYENALALIVEPEEFEAKARNPFFEEDQPESAQNRPTRPEAVATITVFENEGQLRDGEPDEVLESAIVTNTKLAWALSKNLGKTLLLTLDEQRFKSKRGSYKAWVWVPVEDAKVREQIVAFLDERDSGTPPWED